MNTHLTLHHDETIHDDWFNSGPRFATAWTLRATGEKFKVSSVNQPNTSETMIFPHRDDADSGDCGPLFCDPDDPWIYFPVREDKTHRHTVREHRLFLQDFLANRVDN